MYKCMKCGNTEKFIGVVSEKGTAYIYQTARNRHDKEELRWIYILSKNSWTASSRPQVCYYCGSKNIKRLKAC